MIRHTLFAASFFAVTCALQAARVTIQETTDGLILSNGPVTLSLSPQTASWILDEQPRAFLLPHLTNTSVSADWAVDVRRGRPAKTVWLGVQDPVSNIYRAIGFTLTPRSAAPQCIWLSASAPAAADLLIREAYDLRQKGRFAPASKALRKAAACNPLDVWNRVERTFLEDDGEGAVSAACQNRGDPVATLKNILSAYEQLGATNEVAVLRRQAAARGFNLASDNRTAK